MKSWDLENLDLKPRLPEILSSTPAGRAIILDLREGENLAEHEVHERAWVVVLDGEVEVTDAAGGPVGIASLPAIRVSSLNSAAVPQPHPAPPARRRSRPPPA